MSKIKLSEFAEVSRYVVACPECSGVLGIKGIQSTDRIFTCYCGFQGEVP